MGSTGAFGVLLADVGASIHHRKLLMWFTFTSITEKCISMTLLCRLYSILQQQTVCYPGLTRLYTELNLAQILHLYP